MEPVTGLPAIMAVYGQIAKGMADSKHFWTVTEFDDGRLECHWVQAARATDGRLIPERHRARHRQCRRADHAPEQPHGARRQLGLKVSRGPAPRTAAARPLRSKPNDGTGRP